MLKNLVMTGELRASGLKLKILTKKMQKGLSKLKKKFLQRCIRYGDCDKTENGRKYCIRSKKTSKGVKVRNRITPYPEFLKPPHVTFMLQHNVQLPNPDIAELCHLCADANPKRKSRRNSGALCFEGCHTMLGSHRYNLSMIECQWLINYLVVISRRNPDIRTTGTIYLEDLIKWYPIAWECQHEVPCFGNYGEIKGRDLRLVLRNERSAESK